MATATILASELLDRPLEVLNLPDHSTFRTLQAGSDKPILLIFLRHFG